MRRRLIRRIQVTMEITMIHHLDDGAFKEKLDKGLIKRSSSWRFGYVIVCSPSCS
jgi:hypothetical protein